MMEVQEDFACPCCGASMPGGAPADALAFLPMSPHHRLMLDALIKAYPRLRSVESLINDVWGLDPNGGPISAENGINVMQSRINSVIRAYGWEIRGGRTGGYGGKRLYPLANDEGRRQS